MRVHAVAQVKQAGGHDGRQDRQIDGSWKLQRYGAAKIHARGNARRLLVLCLSRTLIAAAIGMRMREEQRRG